MADSNETCATAKEEREEELAMEQGTYKQAILIQVFCDVKHYWYKISIGADVR